MRDSKPLKQKRLLHAPDRYIIYLECGNEIVLRSIVQNPWNRLLTL